MLVNYSLFIDYIAQFNVCTSKLSSRWKKLDDKFMNKVQCWYGTVEIMRWKIDKAI